MAIQDGPGPTMAATNGPPGPVMAAIIGPPLPSLVPWPGDLYRGSHKWSWGPFVAAMVGPGPSIAGLGPRIAAANGPGPTKAAEIGPS